MLHKFLLTAINNERHLDSHVSNVWASWASRDCGLLKQHFLDLLGGWMQVAQASFSVVMLDISVFCAG